MSKLSIVTLIACAISMPSAMAASENAHYLNPQGKVNFSGHVYSGSCKIATGDENKQVKLNPVLNTLVNKLSATQLQPFSIQVNDCYIHEKLVPKLVWNDNTLLTAQGYLKNTANNGAENVALILKDSKGRSIDLHNENAQFEPEKDYLKGDKPTLTYKFSVGYIIPFESPVLARVKPGPVSAQANYSITYL
ncbi:fimbrial protein [Citrobacter freundii]|uniref:fimbrial protein n=1 Tax=Citrobacter freundii TaxID=546 RepID=UPI00222E88B4|nr:type 1 fimbrial protein [Citrobacter freundii]